MFRFQVCYSELLLSMPSTLTNEEEGARNVKFLCCRDESRLNFPLPTSFWYKERVECKGFDFPLLSTFKHELQNILIFYQASPGVGGGEWILIQHLATFSCLYFLSFTQSVRKPHSSFGRFTICFNSSQYDLEVKKIDLGTRKAQDIVLTPLLSIC